MFLIDWLVANWTEIAGAAAAGYAFAVAVAKLTPTTADDDVLASLHGKFGAILAILPLPAVSPVAKALSASAKADAALDKAALTAAAKAEAVDVAKSKASEKATK
jgi:hypothetical protein